MHQNRFLVERTNNINRYITQFGVSKQRLPSVPLFQRAPEPLSETLDMKVDHLRQLFEKFKVDS